MPSHPPSSAPSRLQHTAQLVLTHPAAPPNTPERACTLSVTSALISSLDTLPLPGPPRPGRQQASLSRAPAP